MKFIDYNSYLLESTTDDNLIYEYYITQNKKHVYIVGKLNDVIISFIYGRQRNFVYEVVSVAAEHGYGHKIYQSLLQLVNPSWIVPSRNGYIQPTLFKLYSRLIDDINIKSEKLDTQDLNYKKVSPEYNNWFNRKYRLNNPLDINLISSDVRVKYDGLKFFTSKYNWKNKESIL